MYIIKINVQPVIVKHGTYCSLSSEFLPGPLASGNIPTLNAIFIDIPCRRVEYIYYIIS